MDSISPSTDFQEALQFTLLEYMNYVKSDTLANSSDLFELALMCPDSLGDAVYHARSLIRVDSLINGFDDENACNYINPRSLVELQNEGKISPNPASESIELQFSTEIVSLQVYNISGQDISTSAVIDGSFAQISVQNLPDGIYFIRVLDNRQKTNTYKFIVSH